MTISVTKEHVGAADGLADVIVIDLANQTNGNDLNIRTTPQDARELAEKILAALAL